MRSFVGTLGRAGGHALGVLVLGCAVSCGTSSTGSPGAASTGPSSSSSGGGGLDGGGSGGGAASSGGISSSGGSASGGGTGSSSGSSSGSASGGGSGASSGSGGSSSGSAGGSGGPPGMGPDGGALAVPEFGSDSTRKLVVVGTSKDGLSTPRDLKFDPMIPTQLWTVNEGTDGVVIYTNPGASGQTVDARVDFYARHFMAKVSSISFDAGGLNEFGTCQESDDEWNDVPVPTPDDFMGPTLWPADLSIFAKVNQSAPPPPEGSHIDMNHESPLCMGIAWDHDLVYWAYDGKNANIVRYDFVKDHGPGGQDHSASVVRRYSDATVTRVPEVPSHMVMDHSSGLLYVADTGGARIMTLDTNSGAMSAALPQTAEPVAEYSSYTGVTYKQLIGGLTQPCGIELNKGRLFVSDHKTGVISAYTLSGTLIGSMSTGAQGLMGITIGPDGKLWYVDATAQTVVRVDPR